MISRNLKQIFRFVSAVPLLLFLMLATGTSQAWAIEPVMASVSAGTSHTLAIDTTFKVYGWGSNEFGQLGDGTNVQRTKPVNTGITNVQQVAAGDAHSLALLNDGTVKAWGFNGSGQLGNSTTVLLNSTSPLLSLSPVLVKATTGALTGVAAIAAGLNHSLALKLDGSVLSWGKNAAGQLGINSTVDAYQATAITALNGHSIMAVAAGHNHSLALRSDGKVYAWGVNESGQLGDSKTVSLKVPTQITVLSNIVALAAGAKHSLALSYDGTVWAWGANSSGQLGNKTTTASLVPVQVWGPNSGPGAPTCVPGDSVPVGALSCVVAIAANGDHSLALLKDGTIWAWGSNAVGQEGDGTTGNVSKQAKQVGTLTGVTPFLSSGGPSRIAAGTSHSVVVLSSGIAKSWGGNWYGQLGDNSLIEQQSSPVPIAAVDTLPSATTTPSANIAAGTSHTLKNDFAGAAFGWGSNEFGQVGDDTTVQRTLPVAALLLPAPPPVVRQVAAGDAHSLALLSDKSVAAWGANGYGQLGNNTTVQSLRRVPVGVTTGTLAGARAIAAGLNHSLALKEDGSVLSWGQNTIGQLGINSTVDAKQATSILTLTRVAITAVTSGYNHSLALHHDGSVYAWGINESGQLGDGKTVNLKVPTQISALSNIVALASGEKHSLALRNDGTVWAWGANSSGQIGDGTLTTRSAPVQVLGLPAAVAVVAIAAGGSHSLALLSNREIWAWGNNSTCQLGDGTNVNNSTPQRVDAVTIPPLSSPLGRAITIAAGKAHSAAIWIDSSILAWGDNSKGQLGNNGTPTLGCSVTPPPTSGTLTLSAGTSHTLAVNTPLMSLSVAGGAALGWGSNEFGQVGDSTTVRRKQPVATSLTTGVWQVAAGDVHSLALLTNGTVKAWGFNGFGQLGDNTTTLSPVPVDTTTILVSTDVPPVTSFPPLDGVTAIAAGLHHSLALKSDGSVLSWGRNAAGQLGINSTVDASHATLITTLAGASITAITAGQNHSLALRHDGAVYAWGINESGQLGDGKTVNLKVPTLISALSNYNIIALAAGAKHSLALRNDGTVWAWGGNNAGQLGNGTTTASLIPVQVGVGLLSGVIAIAANGEHSLALLSSGEIWAWGNNGAGQLGDGTNVNNAIPQKVLGIPILPLAVAIAAGTAHSAAIWSDGSMQTWGGNWRGQLGDNTRERKSSPVAIPPGPTIPVAPTPDPDISAGDSNTLAVDTSGVVYGWGSNEFGQVGNGLAQPVTKAIKITSITGIASRVAAGDAHSLVLLTDGTVKAWGYNGSGQLGDGTLIQKLIPVSTLDASGSLSAVVAISAGRAHSLALKSDGSLRSWGQNASGQLGINSVIAANKATAIPTLDKLPITAITSGHDHSLALRHDGVVYAWGVNESGQLGDGKTVSLKVPTQISALANIIALAAGTKHSLALRNDGTVWAWGANSSGQIGNGTLTASLVPVQVSGWSGAVIAIAANGEYSLALVDDGSGTTGTLWAWGNNAVGQLGDGTTLNRSTPVSVGTLTGIQAIAAGTSHSVAIGFDGHAWAWGGNWNGQLGTGNITTENLPSPQDVSGIGAFTSGTLGAFNPLNSVPLSTPLTSNTLFLGTFSGTVPISVSGGTYSVNGQPYTSSPSMVSDRSSVVVRQTSSAQPRTKTTATLTVGPKSASFDVTTRSKGNMTPILMLLLD